jgi:hypothetical protein
MSMSLIILRENGAETQVDRTKHSGMSHNLDEATRPGGDGEKDAGGEEDEEDHGDEDVCVEGEHLSVGT